MTDTRYNRLLLTGAAGALGKVLRQRLKPWCATLRLSDIADLGAAGANEELVRCDLADAKAVDELLAGVDAVVHMGGISVDGPWEPILRGNIMGVHNLYEAVRRHKVKRVVFASSNHAIGFYPQKQPIAIDVPPRPDGNYGTSKAFGENLSRFYFDRYGVETVCLRIGSCFPEPRDRRMLITWLSYDDMTELVRCSLMAPKVGHSIVYGVSNNRDKWWDNSAAAHLGFHPKDSAEPFRAKLEQTPALPEDDPAKIYMGGAYAKGGPY
jgi:uronate dehydrogenase